jgi:hypothetical protein
VIQIININGSSSISMEETYQNKKITQERIKLLNRVN